MCFRACAVLRAYAHSREYVRIHCLCVRVFSLLILHLSLRLFKCLFFFVSLIACFSSLPILLASVLCIPVNLFDFFLYFYAPLVDQVAGQIVADFVQVDQSK